MDALQDVMKNTKMRQYNQIHYKPASDGTNGARVGIAAPGKTRWQSRSEQLQQQLTLRTTMQMFTIDPKWNQRLDMRMKDMINDVGHWEMVKGLQEDLDKFLHSITKCQGIY